MTKYAFDVWFSDGNDRSCIGVLAVESEDLESASWKALDAAIEAYSKPEIEWETPYMDACAVTHYKVCDHDEDSEDCDSECYQSESISVEPCEDPTEDYYHHSPVELASL